MLETDLTVEVQENTEDLVFKDYQKPLHGPLAVFSTTYIIAQLFTWSMPCVLFRLCHTVQTTQNYVIIGFLTFYFFIQCQCHNWICVSFLNIPIKLHSMETLDSTTKIHV